MKIKHLLFLTTLSTVLFGTIDNHAFGNSFNNNGLTQQYEAVNNPLLHQQEEVEESKVELQETKENTTEKVDNLQNQDKKTRGKFFTNLKNNLSTLNQHAKDKTSIFLSGLYTCVEEVAKTVASCTVFLLDCTIKCTDNFVVENIMTDFSNVFAHVLLSCKSLFVNSLYTGTLCGSVEFLKDISNLLLTAGDDAYYMIQQCFMFIGNVAYNINEEIKYSWQFIKTHKLLIGLIVICSIGALKDEKKLSTKAFKFFKRVFTNYAIKEYNKSKQAKKINIFKAIKDFTKNINKKIQTACIKIINQIQEFINRILAKITNTEQSLIRAQQNTI